jgi:SAM-dependent methyltransferase
MTQWSLRKLRLPIHSTDLVLDVGSGANPHPRADVLLERYVSGEHRHGALAVADRPIVFADACRMPFKDKAFDYVIAFHVLEHVPTPELFLNELMRIAKAGYIETPNVMFEHMLPYDVHCLEVMNLGERLFIRKKPAPAADAFLGKLNVFSESPRWNEFFYGNPEFFHVRHHWKDRIDYEVTNPEEPCAWHMRGSTQSEVDVAHSPAPAGVRGAATSALRSYYKFWRPPPNLKPLLVCPDCRSALVEDHSSFRCGRCGRSYTGQPWPVFVQQAEHRVTNGMEVTP